MVARYSAAGAVGTPLLGTRALPDPAPSWYSLGAHVASLRVVVRLLSALISTFLMRFLRRFGRTLLVSGSLLTGCQPDHPPTTQVPAARAPRPVILPRRPLPSAVLAPAPVPVPALYAAPGLLHYPEHLLQRADIAGDYRPHPIPMTFSRLRTIHHVRRYAGWAGPYRATVELAWQRPDSVSGSCYLTQPGRSLQLTLGTDRHRAYPGRTVLTLVQPKPTQVAGTWRLASWPASVLTGTWMDGSGHRYRLQLREHYAGAVPYEVERLVLQGGRSVALEEDPRDTRVPFQYQEYLHLLGPARRWPALCQRLAPPLAVRRRQLRAAYEHERTYGGIAVRLNADYLLSYQTLYLADPYGGRPQPGVKSFLVDLRNGHDLTLASQLRPGYELPLRRVLTRQLLAEAIHDDESGDRTRRIAQVLKKNTPAGSEPLVALPLSEPESLTDEDLLLTDQGLEASFSDVAVLGNLWSRFTPTTVIPYAELRPLVRPGTPLARLLQARGMW
jgi:hypothetical protein